MLYENPLYYSGSVRAFFAEDATSFFARAWLLRDPSARSYPFVSLPLAIDGGEPQVDHAMAIHTNEIYVSLGEVGVRGGCTPLPWQLDEGLVVDVRHSDGAACDLAVERYDPGRILVVQSPGGREATQVRYRPELVPASDRMFNRGGRTVPSAERPIHAANYAPPAHWMDARDEDATSPPLGETGDSDPAVYLMDTYDLDLEEAVLRIELQRFNNEVRVRAADHYPDTFAGSWTDHADGGTVYYAFTEAPEASLRALRAGHPAPERLRAVTRPYSLRTLRLIGDALVEARFMLLGPDKPVVVGWYVDEEASSVVVLAHPDGVSAVSELLATLVPLLDPPVIAVQGHEGYFAYATACAGNTELEQRRRCPRPLRGGIQIHKDGSTRGCSLGFNARHGLTPQILTAGHCDPDGAWNHDAKRIGPTRDYIEPSPTRPSRVDAARVQVNNLYHNVLNPSGWTLSRWVYDSRDAHAFQIRDTARAAAYTRGDVVCRSGRSTGRRCGAVLANTFYFPRVRDLGAVVSGDWGLHLDHYWIQQCARGGDSGGPVYDRGGGQGTALGLVSLSGFIPEDGNTPPCNPRAEDNPGQSYLASKIDHIQSELDVRVITQP